MIRGTHVTLRRVEESDLPDIQRWQNDPDVFRWMDYEEPFSFEDIRRSEERAKQEGHPFVIEVAGKGVGRTGLNNFRRRDRMASLYIFIGEPEAQRRGYGLDALMALLAYGFDVLNLRRIELWMLDGNDRAARMYKAAGFVEDARLPERSAKDGVYVDHLIMSVDRDAFERARAADGV